MLSKITRVVVLATVVILIAIQFVQPVRRNPPADPAASFAVVAKPAPEVVAVFRRACADCHSNETTWPWYSRVAPASWLVANDVNAGRAHMNLSEWNLLGPEASRIKLKVACREAKQGKMPLWQYRLMHKDARLSPADVEAICSAPEFVSRLQ
jgi:hypothetical protein